MNAQMLMLPIAASKIADTRVKVNVPVVTGGTSADAIRTINQTIVKETHALMKAQGYPSSDIQEMDGTFEIKTNQRGVLSLSLLNYTFTGGAHGNTLQRSLTFDAETGRTYRLGELFKPDSSYISRLNAIIEAQIKARGLPLLGDYPGITEEQDYYIADKALVIYFPLYAIVPYAWGFPYFPISVYEIEDIIDENGPLGVMLY
ncbi:DUF3298 DUF4163 domains-containing protein [Cohnella lubricantis]|uniref:DUF3298 and DUF4163 domain-containing protein n=1 Tax=Cohnella lubricantis TaxID=2163172 RepID=A0A841TI74_9BACL|nr:DUF3298 and DUF4163 domain-containing protein [Cohnella lubricantis]MBB6678647.1 DUF3298 and DUF4163 domain-containing protein [Cohnella lubricantis]MBP2119193.1 hypothetical protein [Cohnella lubricantis]